MYDTASPSSAVVSRIRTASLRPATLGACPPDVISLAMGEPDQGTPRVVLDAAIASLRAGHTKYTALTGHPQLREALAANLKSAANRTLGAEEVVVTHGGAAGLAATILAVVNPGDRVLLPEPTYSLYADLVAMAGGIVDWIPLDPKFALDEDLLERSVSECVLVVVCNPSNPTGAVIGHTQLERLVDLSQRHAFSLLVDEAYCDIVFEHVNGFSSALPYVSKDTRVIVCRTFSKTFAMTGWRLGYIVANRDIAAAINLVHRTFNGAVSTFVQEGGIAALGLPGEFFRELVVTYQRRRDLVVNRLQSIEGVDVVPPSGAFYAFPSIDGPWSSGQLTDAFAQAGLLVRSGREFGPSGEGQVRLSFAADDDALIHGLDRFSDVVQSLNVDGL